MTRLTQEGVFEVADRLYRHMNPDSKMNTPNTAYILTEKWYNEYIAAEPEMEFFDWCIATKSIHVKKMQPVAAVTDGDGHWYVIPHADGTLFREMLERGEADEYAAFNDRFGKYRTGGDLNNIQLHAKI